MMIINTLIFLPTIRFRDGTANRLLERTIVNRYSFEHSFGTPFREIYLNPSFFEVHHVNVQSIYCQFVCHIVSLLSNAS